MTMVDVAGEVRLIRAPNPGPMTLQGTNTWLLGHPGEAVLVVDPGPDDVDHLDEVAAMAGDVATIVLTHRHADHSAGAATLAARTGASVLAADPAFRSGDAGLSDGDELGAGDLRVRVLGTPGHTSDSVCLLVSRPDAAPLLLTGDTVLGQGTTVIAAPDGDLGAYLDSLARLQAVVAEQGVAAILPGRGPVVGEAVAVLAHYVRHRQDRLDQVRAALAAGDSTADEVVARVYADVDRSVWPAARQSVDAQLRYVESERSRRRS